MTALLLAAILLGAAPPEAAATPVPLPRPTVATPATITPLGAVWRSTLIPGWGQRYKGERRKGAVHSFVAGGMFAASAVTFVEMENAKREYRRQDVADDADESYQRVVNATIMFDATALATAGFWAFNVFDAGFSASAPLSIRDARVRDVYPAFQGFYATNGLADVRLENRSNEPIDRIVVRLEIPDLLSAPAEGRVVERIPPGAGMGASVQIPAALDARIWKFAGKEPKPVTARIIVEYNVKGRKRELTSTATLFVHGANAIVWDDSARLGAFVTARDETVRTLASRALAPRTGFPARNRIDQAARLFDAMGARGLSYVSDPTAPFQYFDGNAGATDYLAFPSETLARSTGDCDDLTALYAALLEGVGIPTAILDVPGHVLLAFDAGMPSAELERISGEELVLDREGRGWIAVETTAVGKTFGDAWKFGATQVKKWRGLEQLKIVDMSYAWSLYAPAAFPTKAAQAIPLDDAKFVRLLTADAALLEDMRTKARDLLVTEIRARKLAPAAEADAIGIAMARSGDLEEAEKRFRAAIAIDPKSGRALNNLASVFFLNGRQTEAIRALEQALSVSGDSGPVLLNLARVYYEMGDRESSKAHFARASRLDPTLPIRHPELAALESDASEKDERKGAVLGVWEWEWAP